MKCNHLRVILSLKIFCLAVIVPALAQGPQLHISSLRFTVPKPELTVADVDAQITAGPTIPLWKAVATTNGVNYDISLVGKSIFLVGPSESVSIPAPVVALDLRFYNGSGTSPLT